MAYKVTDTNLPLEEDHPSLVEKVFPHPDTVCEGEYITIYEFLLNPDIRDDPQLIAGVLKEFSGWALSMLEEMQRLGLIDPTELPVQLRLLKAGKDFKE
jgi:hypothetical protein